MNICHKRAPVSVNPVFINPNERRVSLDGPWCFKLDPDDVGLQEQWFNNIEIMYEQIKVPGCWQGQGFGGDDEETIWDFELSERIYRATYKGTGWYGKRFFVPKEYKGSRLWVCFGGVNPSCEVWVNGTSLGRHGAPFVPFAFEITDTVAYGEENSLAVRVCEGDRILGFGLNGQGSWSGLYRGVDIVATGQCFIDSFRIYPDVESGDINFKVNIEEYESAAKPVTLAVAVFECGSDTALAAKDIEVASGTPEFLLSLTNPSLWSPDSPALYRVEAVLTDGSGEVMDACTERTGFTKLSSRVRHFLINGEPYFMRGAGDFVANPETGCPDTDRERWRKKLSNLRAYGYNYIRCQSFVPTPEFFDVADEVGLLVQSEMGMMGAWGGKSQWHSFSWPRPTPRYRQKLKWQWDRVVMRDVNHPSANIYCMSNELACFGPYLYNILHPRITWQCYNDTKAIKPSAFVIYTDGGMDKVGEHVMPGDFINHNTTDIDECLNSTKPFIGHEFRWWSSFPDVRIAHKYSGAMRPYGAEIAIKAAGKHNMLHLLPTFAVNSQKLQFIEAKSKLEACRRDYHELAGINHFNGVDLNPSPQGILDEFYEKKYADSATWMETNGDTVIMVSSNFDDRILESGGRLCCNFSVSDFSHPALKSPTLSWTLEGGEEVFLEGEVAYSHRPYLTCKAGGIDIVLPSITKPAQLELRVKLTEDSRSFTNCWSYWVFPVQEKPFAGAVVYGRPDYTWLKQMDSAKTIQPSELKSLPERSVVLAETLDSYLAKFVVDGGRVIVAASEEFVRPSTASLNLSEGRYFFTPPANWAPFDEGQNGTVIQEHPLIGDFPHEGFADFQFYRMTAEVPPLDLESLGLTEGDPVIRVIHRYMTSDRMAYMIEFGCGRGRVIMCSMDMNQEWPESRYMVSQICGYLSSKDLADAPTISTEHLERIVEIGDISR